MAAMRGTVGPILLLSVLLAATGCQEYGLDEILYTDVFTQGSDVDAVVDLLFIIDNSGTMSEEQQRLAASLGGLMVLLEETLADFRLGIITTDVEDPDHRGRLQGEPAVLGPGTPDLPGAFIANSQVGTGGSRDEQGLSALQLALTEAVDAGANEGFFRSAAARGSRGASAWRTGPPCSRASGWRPWDCRTPSCSATSQISRPSRSGSTMCESPSGNPMAGATSPASTP